MDIKKVSPEERTSFAGEMIIAGNGAAMEQHRILIHLFELNDYYW
jgi:hypothetical protein